MRVSRSEVQRAWSLGLNWVVFLVAWFIFSAIIGGIENSMMNREARSMMEIEAGRSHLTEYLIHLKEKAEPGDTNKTHLIDKFLHIIQKDRFFQIVNDLDQYDNHVRVETEKYRLIREQLIEKNATMPRNDTEEVELVEELIDLLGNPHLMELFCEDSWCLHKREVDGHGEEENIEEGGREQEEEYDEYLWSFGHSLHFVSTIFTTLGYGMKIPATGMGKFLTVVMILTLLPFFLHCIATTSTNINRLINRLLGATENYEDLEDLTASEGGDGKNRKAGVAITLQGAAVLVGVMSGHLLLSAVYHYITTGWHFGDVLYYEFVSYSTIGFGDMVPEEDLTVAGAILKNMVVKIPACILLITTTIRLWPLIS